MVEAGAYRGLLADAADYYARKLREHGPTARGADWNSEASQSLRFTELLRLLPQNPSAGPPPSLCDLGCGYGALLDHLREAGHRASYTGVDVSDVMIAEARSLHGEGECVQWQRGDRPPHAHDYVVASGIFNVRGDTADGDWRDYIAHVIGLMDAASRCGFSFNCLSACSDPDRREPRLYYAEPADLLAVCQRGHSRHVAMLHDYGLYEFTMIVRKEPR